MLHHTHHEHLQSCWTDLEADAQSYAHASPLPPHVRACIYLPTPFILVNGNPWYPHVPDDTFVPKHSPSKNA